MRHPSERVIFLNMQAPSSQTQPTWKSSRNILKRTGQETLKACDYLVVLDTNIIIDFLLGKEKIINLVDRYSGDELAMTFVNQYELLKYKSQRILDEAIQNLYIYQSSDLSASASAKAYHKLKSNGKIMSDNDLLIFGVCVANNESLITQDKAFLALESKLVSVVD